MNKEKKGNGHTREHEHLAMLQQQIKSAHKRKREEETPLTIEQRNNIIETFRRLLDGMYAHLPLKRAAYGFDPSQRLRLLGKRAGNQNLTDNVFHREMAQIFTDLRDAHTRYLAPQSNRNEASFLPILVEHFVEGGKSIFVASKVKGLETSEKSRFAKAGFVDGVELEYWNGVPIERAVDLYAERETGGRPDARLARALESLTIRPARYALPPDEKWVEVSFKTKNNTLRDIRLNWEIIDLTAEPALPSGSAGQALAYNPIADGTRQVKKMLFAGNVWVTEQRQASRKESKPGSAFSTVQESIDSGWAEKPTQALTGNFGALVYAKHIKLKSRSFGYLRIYSFQVNNDQAFIEEIIHLVEQMPRSGLVIDLRSNPGGNIWAAEGLLQLFTPHSITPTRFSILATDMTRAMATAPQNRNMVSWAESLQNALTTGVSHSHSEPLTPIARCNNFGQRYSGPVVVIVDANTYSAGELFAAGVVDNNVGKLICTDKATGGGGANVWTPDIVNTALKGTGFELPDLGGVSFTLSARRAERIGAESRYIEDAGVSAVFRRPLTRDDLVNKNRDLLAYACRHLASEVRSEMDFEIQPVAGSGSGGTMDHALLVKTVGISQLRINYDGVTRTIGASLDPELTPSGKMKHQQQTLALENGWTQHRVELLGYDQTTLRQRRLVVPT